jgi:two-component system nitrogen regulation response regulator NtrX
MLIVDDEANIRRTMEMIHKNAGWETSSVDGGNAALELMEKEQFDVIFLDLSMPERNGIDVLKEIKLRRPEQVVIILTGQGTIEKAVEAVKLGAFDFLDKDCGKDRILLTSHNAFEAKRLSDENKQLKNKISKRQEFIGRSRTVKAIFDQIAKVAPSNARVLILGESGTGKELIAQTIHDRSRRAEGPFIKVNCAAIPEELIEAELFGSVKGAYTGSVESRVGKFQAADGGTIFLDEIGDMSLRVQTKVLRALQEGEVTKVGSDKTIKVDARVIAATNKNLEHEIAQGRFREDLYFRLNVVPITSPPLRARPDDIPLLAEAFIKDYCIDNGLPLKNMDDKALGLLTRYPWPGNVRELRNQVERLVIMSADKVIQAGDLSREIRDGIPAVAASGPRIDIEMIEDAQKNAGPARNNTFQSVSDSTPSVSTHELRTQSFQDAKKRFERHLILQALERNDWNITRTAEELALERTNLHKKIKTYGLARKK